jgi:CHAD domain-containing protein
MRIDGKTPLWIAARSLLTLRGEDFRRRLANVLQTFDPEAIHDLRVSSRRLREGLALFAPCYPAEGVVRLDRRIRKVTRLLGDIRNRDEAVLFFAALREELDVSCGSALDMLITAFEQERAAELKRLDRGLRAIAAAELSRQYRRLVDFPALFTASASGADLFSPLEEFSCSALGSRLADVLRLVPAARQAGNVADQHQLRIAVKHFRYRLEILSFLFGGDYADIHAVVKTYQELLGKMHDLDVFAAVCQDASLPLPAAAVIQEVIEAKREKLFGKFSTMLARLPFEEIGGRLAILQ